MTSTGGEHPNIVLVYFDDLGYGDVGVYGATSLPTPNMDRLAESGLRFTDGYASSATCTPSRYALMTGEYPWRNQDARILAGDAPLLIEAGRVTLPSMLQEHGYRTGIVGKWHLGLGSGPIDWNSQIRPGPNEVGFEESFIIAATQDRVPTVFLRNGRVVDLDPDDPIEVSYEENFEGEPTGLDRPDLLRLHWTHGHHDSIVNGIPRIGFMRGGRTARWVDEDMADTFLGEARRFISEDDSRPFFLYLPLHQPHVPRTPHPRFVGSSGLGPRGDAIVEADWCVGEVLRALDEAGLTDDTLVILSSDNGPVLNDGYRDGAVELAGTHRAAGPLRGGKYSLFDGGTRVPLIVSWHGHVEPGVSAALVCQMDLLASLAALVGDDREPCDSVDTIDAFLGRADSGRESLVVEAQSRTALRHGRWVMIPPSAGPAVMPTTGIETGHMDHYQLYDLDDDTGQHNDLAGDRPELLRQLIDEYEGIVGAHARAN